jgi:hypothetical protein
MMKALAEVALASDSALYRGSPDTTPTRLRLSFSRGARHKPGSFSIDQILMGQKGNN